MMFFLYLHLFSGLVPSEDMPDIVANTALEKLSDEQMNRLNISFLEHPQSMSDVTPQFHLSLKLKFQ